MCDFSGKLIAWLDGELPADEAGEVERHLEACSECKSDADAYKRVSSEFDAYCDEANASKVRHEVPRWVPAVSAASAVAALVALFLILPRTPVDPRAFHAPQVAASPAVLAEVLSAPVIPTHKVHGRQAVKHVQIENSIAQSSQNQNDDPLPNESVIQIAIPADEMFPPGAVPEGMQFAADLTIAADGSAERLRLHPRLAAFERRTTQQ
jgi:hypothetical protein